MTRSPTATTTTSPNEQVVTHIIDQTRWISQLPYGDEETADDLVIIGWLVPASCDSTRIITGSLCLTFATADVLAVDEKLDESYSEHDNRRAHHVRIVVRRGAALWNVCPEECMEDMLPPGRRPFAFSSRPSGPQASRRSRFAELEEDFLFRTGLKPRDS
jgi:hypothetical protein